MRTSSPVSGSFHLEVGTRLWIPCEKQVWRAGVIVGRQDEFINECWKRQVVVEVRDGRDQAGEKLLIDTGASSAKGGPGYLQRSVDLLSKEDAKAVEDLSLMSFLQEPEILHVLSMRYATQNIYTFAGPMLLAVNPYQEIAGLYDNAVLQRFVSTPRGCPSPMPHIFGTARDAYSGIQHSNMAQTVLVSGESGAGKTESAKFVIRFLALAGGRKPEANEVTMEHRVLESVPLLEALGNARTLKNDNSSRFGKFIELQFRNLAAGAFGPCIVDAETHTYLLESVRVTELNEGERCFHIFYQILAAAARARTNPSFKKMKAAEAPALQLSSSIPSLTFPGLNECEPSKFGFLAQSSCVKLSGTDEAMQFDRTVEAMRTFDMTDDEISQVIGAIVAVLHLGNIEFQSCPGNSEAAETVDIDGPLCLASDLLGVNREDLATALCMRALQVHEKSTKQVIRTPRTPDQARTCRDALARHLYGLVFKYTVSRINGVLSGRSADSDEFSTNSTRLPSIGVLDIFGFEVFERNCFEQLCINFANEVLQQHFNMVVFEHELSLYETEGIPCDIQEANAAVPQQHLRDTVVRTGLFPMLDEECSISGGTSDSWLNKVTTRYGNSGVFELPRLRKGYFMLHHFAGPVEYCADNFLAKNKDHLSTEGMECMQGSSKTVLQEQFNNHERKFGTSVSERKVGRILRAKKHTVSSDFRDQLDNLMKTIQATRTHFVRCLRPNQIAKPDSFDFHSVLQQLRYQGVIEAIRVARFGYAFRLSHQQAVDTYKTLAPPRLRSVIGVQMSCDKHQEASQILFSTLKETLSGLDANGIQVGKTLTFFKSEAMEVLGNHVRAFRVAAALQVQSVWRSVRCVRRFNTIRKAVLRFQKVGRGRQARRAFRRSVRAIIRLQAWRRGSYQRARFRAMVKVAICMQRWVRRIRAKKCRLTQEGGMRKETDSSVMPEPEAEANPPAVPPTSTQGSLERGILAEQQQLGAEEYRALRMRLERMVAGFQKEEAEAYQALQTEIQQNRSTMKDEVYNLNASIISVQSKVERVSALERLIMELDEEVKQAHADNAEKSALLAELSQEQNRVYHQMQSVDAAASTACNQASAVLTSVAHISSAHEALHSHLQSQLSALKEEAKVDVEKVSSNFLVMMEKHQLGASSLEQVPVLEQLLRQVRGDVEQLQSEAVAKQDLLSRSAQEQQGTNLTFERLISEVRGDVQRVRADSREKQALLSRISQEQEGTNEKLRAIDAAVAKAREQAEAEKNQLKQEQHALQMSFQLQLAEMKQEAANLSSSLAALSDRHHHQEPQVEKLEKLSALEGRILQAQQDAAVSEKQALLSSLAEEQQRANLQMKSVDEAVLAVREQTEVQQARLKWEQEDLQARVQTQIAALRDEICSQRSGSEMDAASIKTSFLAFEDFVNLKFKMIEKSVEESSSEAGQQKLEAAVQAMCGGMTAHQESVDKLCADLEPKLSTLASKDELADIQRHMAELRAKHQSMMTENKTMTIACIDLKSQFAKLLQEQQQQHTASLTSLREEMAGSLEEALTTLRSYLTTAHGLTKTLDSQHEEHEAELKAMRREMAASIGTALSSLHQSGLDPSQSLDDQAQQVPQTPQRLPLRQLPLPSMSARTRATPQSTEKRSTNSLLSSPTVPATSMGPSLQTELGPNSTQFAKEAAYREWFSQSLFHSTPRQSPSPARANTPLSRSARSIDLPQYGRLVPFRAQVLPPRVLSSSPPPQGRRPEVGTSCPVPRAVRAEVRSTSSTQLSPRWVPPDATTQVIVDRNITSPRWLPREDTGISCASARGATPTGIHAAPGPPKSVVRTTSYCSRRNVGTPTFPPRSVNPTPTIAPAIVAACKRAIGNQPHLFPTVTGVTIPAPPLELPPSAAAPSPALDGRRVDIQVNVRSNPAAQPQLNPGSLPAMSPSSPQYATIWSPPVLRPVGAHNTAGKPRAFDSADKPGTSSVVPPTTSSVNAEVQNSSAERGRSGSPPPVIHLTAGGAKLFIKPVQRQQTFASETGARSPAVVAIPRADSSFSVSQAAVSRFSRQRSASPDGQMGSERDGTARVPSRYQVLQSPRVHSGTRTRDAKLLTSTSNADMRPPRATPSLT